MLADYHHIFQETLKATSSGEVDAFHFNIVLFLIIGVHSNLKRYQIKYTEITKQ